ncbi:MAG: hypothetical protein MIO92_11885, partial [Methanosarcinaceae archaeon]|nr:hypothetical protein [Methanosarcinaceae archaeon]
LHKSHRVVYATMSVILDCAFSLNWGIRKTNTKVLENSYKNHTIGVLTGLCEGCYNPVKKIQEKHFRN